MERYSLFPFVLEVLLVSSPPTSCLPLLTCYLVSTASNWLWNTIIAVITPYMVGEDEGNLRSSVFFVWGGLCACAFVYAYFLVPETKGLTLEQVDQMFEETTPRKSSKWRPHTTFLAEQKHHHIAPSTHAEKADVEHRDDL